MRSSSVKELAGKKKKKIALQLNNTLNLSCQEKKKLLDKEEEALHKQIHALQKWTDEMDTMNDQQLKEYLQNRPPELKTIKIQNTKPRQKAQRIKKSKSSSSSNGIMASVWKFHKPDNNDSSANSDAQK
ncbi:hypothetical protein Patl1_07785 [Pistacia atlantica]|uniref:Uncharacterized protein n=1 Tax=Pistacia atlantica TaxID=434234 RepID=A0ACC1AJE5_9ROSI|nr:hypothetical protein Patl1_07785 [Pistacia atlantica]